MAAKNWLVPANIKDGGSKLIHWFQQIQNVVAKNLVGFKQKRKMLVAKIRAGSSKIKSWFQQKKCRRISPHLSPWFSIAAQPPPRWFQRLHRLVAAKTAASSSIAVSPGCTPSPRLQHTEHPQVAVARGASSRTPVLHELQCVVTAVVAPQSHGCSTWCTTVSHHGGHAMACGWKVSGWPWRKRRNRGWGLSRLLGEEIRQCVWTRNVWKPLADKNPG